MNEPKTITLRDLAAILPKDMMFTVTNNRADFEQNSDRDYGHFWTLNFVKRKGFPAPGYADAPIREAKPVWDDTISVLVDWRADGDAL